MNLTDEDSGGGLFLRSDGNICGVNDPEKLIISRQRAHTVL
jgi:hypothetical protein